MAQCRKKMHISDFCLFVCFPSCKVAIKSINLARNVTHSNPEMFLGKFGSACIENMLEILTRTVFQTRPKKLSLHDMTQCLSLIS